MSVLPILTGADHPLLRTKGKKVPKVTKKIKDLIRNMGETMVAADGVGLAAPQVGESLRICVAPINGKFMALINPEITSKSSETNVDEEGCLSLPKIYLPIERSNKITVTFMDSKGQNQERQLELFEARVVKHEVDHLDGILIVDKPTPKAKKL